MRLLMGTLLLGLCFFKPLVADTPFTQTKPLKLGVIPYIGPHGLARTFLPLVKALETELQRPVVFGTSKDFKTFFQQTLSGEYDFYFTAPHMSAYSDRYLKAIRIKKLKKNIRGLLITHNSQSLLSINDLRMKTIATPDPFTVIYLLSQETLETSSLTPGETIFIDPQKSYYNALQLAREHHVAGAFIVEDIFNQLDQTIKNEFRIIAKTKAIPGPMFFAKNGTPQETVDTFKAILAQEKQKELSTEFFDLFIHGVFVDITNQDITQLLPLASQLKAMNDHDSDI